MIFSGWPRISPRKLTGVAVVNLAGRVTVRSPATPAISQTRSSVPRPSGFAPKAVTTVPGRETETPAARAGREPAGVFAVAASAASGAPIFSSLPET